MNGRNGKRSPFVLLFLFFGGSAHAIPVIECRVDPVSIESVDGDQVLAVNCYVSEVPFEVRGYQVSLPCCWTPEPGAVGDICQVDHGTVSCNGGTSCEFAGTCGDGYSVDCVSAAPCLVLDPTACSGAQSECVPTPDPSDPPSLGFCTNSGTCATASPFINAARPDYLFQGVSPNLIAVNKGCIFGQSPRLASGISPGAFAGCGAEVCPGPYYLGSFLYRVEECAKGEFTLPLLCGFGAVDNVPCGDPAGIPGDATRLSAEEPEATIPFSPLGDSVTIRTGACLVGQECMDDIAGCCCEQSLGGVWGGDPIDSECDLADTCDGNGALQPNHRPNGTPCEADGLLCTTELCSNGFCQVNQNLCGACCDSSDATCTDNLALSECQFSNNFHPGQTCANIACELPIPTVSTWGLVALALLLCAAAKVRFGRSAS